MDLPTIRRRPTPFACVARIPEQMARGMDDESSAIPAGSCCAMTHTIARGVVLCAGVALLAFAAACGLDAIPEDQQSSPPGRRPAVAVDVAPVVASELVDAIEVVGSLAPKISADVKSEVTSIVTAVYVTEWVSVRKGTPLARLDTSETEAVIEALKAAEGQALV